MTQVIARSGLGIRIAGILNPWLPHLREGRTDLVGAEIEQWALNLEVVGEGTSLRNPGQPREARSAEDPKEHRLGLVVGVMGKQDGARSHLLRDGT